MLLIPVPISPYLVPYSPLLGDQSPGAQRSRLSSACPQLIIWFLHRLLHELGQGPTNPTNLFIDNHGTLLLAKNPMNHSHTKHIDVWHHFIQQCIAMKSVDAQQIPTANNPTDICTKSLGKQKIWHFRNLIGLSHVHLQFNLGGTWGEGAC